MPTYEYECLECKDKFDAFQKMTEEALTDCPKCQGKVRRLISSGAGLIFKGSGFFITDYKKSCSSGKSQTDKKEQPSCKDSCPAAGQCDKQ
jgi:putative FmdB family regulatory protein